LQIGLQVEEGKQGDEGTKKRRYGFLHARVEYKRKRCGSKEGNCILYPDMRERWD
jgi:hypothetical protein